jgi:Methyl-CpG binding domain
MNYDKRRIDSMQGLPPGWRREEIIRRKGMLTGKVDVYYYGFVYKLLMLMKGMKD